MEAIMQGKSANTTEQKSFVFMATETIIKHSPLDISMLLHISGAHSFLLLTIMWLLCATTFFHYDERPKKINLQERNLYFGSHHSQNATKLKNRPRSPQSPLGIDLTW